MRSKPTTKMIFDNTDDEKKLGSIIRKPGSKKLYVLFCYFGKRVEKTTGLDDTAANRRKVRTWLDRQMQRIEAGTFIFVEAFPAASEAEKIWFSQQEGRNYSRSPKDVIIGDYIEKWEKEVVELFDSHTKRFDYMAILNCWVKPHFKDKTFYELTKLEMKKFIATFKKKIGKDKGETLSLSRSKNIVSVVRTLFYDASDEFHWNLPDPFYKIHKNIPKTNPKVREIFRIEEWMKIIKVIPPWNRPMIELMMLTGMIHSEISGLLRSHISSNHIHIQEAIVRKVKNKTLKTKYRIRKFPISKRIREILDEALARTDSPYVFAEPDGTPYLRENFTERVWTNTIEKCDILYRPPYSIRHSFAAWSLLIGIEPLRLYKLMGHGTKKMVYEKYGDYVEDLESDFWDVLNYMGRDYVEVKRKPRPYYQILSCESFCESQGLNQHNQPILLNK